MLLVATVVAPSPVAGIGLFAVEPIAAGTPVWRFEPGFDVVFDEWAWSAIPPSARAVLAEWAFVVPSLAAVVLCSDGAKFTNHADLPTLVDGGLYAGVTVDVAGRDIAPGEELTADYHALDGLCPFLCERCEDRRPQWFAAASKTG